MSREAAGETERAARILVVDDEESMRVFLQRLLSRRGDRVEVAADGEEARRRIGEEPWDLVLTDVRMPGSDGIALLRWIRERRPGLAVVVMTAFGTIPAAIEAVKAGAQDYVTKPLERREILEVVDRALRAGRLLAENRLLRRLLEEGRRFEGLVGSSRAMRELYGRIDAVADRSGVVLIRGESGTGKELVARAIHARSPRRGGPFVPFHCASVPGNLLGAELFGVEPGAFTGATRERPGAVGRADGGTLFLDEIGEVPLDVQPALLRLLETGEVTRLGGSVGRSLDVRVVAATHRDLRALSDSGVFRSDLFFRLDVFSITVPPLRQRRDDIPDLARHFLALSGRDEDDLGREALALLEAHDWPGNVRQLRNVVERVAATAPPGRIGLEELPAELLEAEADRSAEDLPAMKAAVAGFEARYLDRLLRATAGNVSEAARRAGVSRPTIHSKLQQHGIDPDRYR